MNGEELNRKYWELCGVYLDSDHGKAVWRGKYLGHDCTMSELPPLHLNANLAIAEAMKEFHGLHWNIKMHMKSAMVDVYLAERGRIGIHEEGTGDYCVCEAILKALIAAKEAR